MDRGNIVVIPGQIKGYLHLIFRLYMLDSISWRWISTREL